MKISVTAFITLCCVLLSAPFVRADGTRAPQGVVKLDSIARDYTAVRFDHPKHVAVTGDCGKCHHQHGNSASLPCKECHSIAASTFKNSKTGTFMACKNCHGTYDPAAPGMPGLKVAYHRQCFQCHRGMGEVGESPKGCTLTCHDKANRQVKGTAKSVK